MDPRWGIFIIAVVIGPYLLLASAQRKNWRREDAVAARAAEVATQLLIKQKETADKTAEAARLLVQNNQIVADTAKAVHEKLDAIHTLCNSNLTSALQDQLDSARALLVALRELVTVNRVLDHEPDNETLAELLALEDKVRRLDANLRERQEQTEVADAQILSSDEHG